MNNIVNFITRHNSKPKCHTKKYDRCMPHNITELSKLCPNHIYQLVYSSASHNFFKRIAI
jgi:hypothetical protein